MQIPVDCLLIEGENIEVDESALTGDDLILKK